MGLDGIMGLCQLGSGVVLGEGVEVSLFSMGCGGFWMIWMSIVRGVDVVLY